MTRNATAQNDGEKENTIKRKLTPLLIISLIFPLAGTTARADEVSLPLWGRSKLASVSQLENQIPRDVLGQFSTGALGRYIVLLREKTDLSSVSRIDNRNARRVAVVEALTETANRSQRTILDLLTSAKDSGEVRSFKPFWLLNAIAVESTKGMLLGLASRPEVMEIVADKTVHLIPTNPSDVQELLLTGGINSHFDNWGIQRIGAPAVWELGIDGAGVVVGSIDTGVDFTHPALESKYRGKETTGYDHNYDWWDAVLHLKEPYDDHSHGTHTMGTMVGGDGLGPGFDDVGVAPGATWISAKAFSALGGAVLSSVLEAGQFLTAPTKLDGTDPRPDLAPNVINNSWGYEGCDADFFKDVVSAWRAMGIVPVFAAGNSGPSQGSVGSPADFENSVAVGATDFGDFAAYFSSRGPSCYGEVKPELVAPGVFIRSSVPGGGYNYFDGTSMAAPHIAGTVALMKQAATESLSVDGIEAALATSAHDLGPVGRDNDYGAGLVNAFGAVSEVISLTAGTVAGTVLDSSGAPLAGAEISAASPGEIFATLTDSAGTYSLTLQEGSYELTASGFGYLSATSAVTIERQKTTEENFELATAPTIMISGKVAEAPSGTKLAGATVAVLDAPVPPVTTKNNGSYSISLPAGIYNLRAIKGGCQSADVREVDATSGSVTQNFVLAKKLDALGYVCSEGKFADELGETKLTLEGDDSSTVVSLPFPFEFYGQMYSELTVSTDGFVTVMDQATGKTAAVIIAPSPIISPSPSSSIPDSNPPNGAIYALWSDLSVGGAARGVYVTTLGAAPDRRFVIEYRNFEVDFTRDLVNFSIVLGEDGTFDLRYKSLEGAGDGSLATVGVESPSGLSALQYLFLEPLLSDRTAIHFELGQVGFIEGTVTNAVDGLPVSGATVDIDGGRTILTDGDGKYRIAVFPGVHDADVSATNYGSVETPGIPVNVDQTVRQDFALPAASGSLAPSELSFESTCETKSGSVTVSNGGTLPLDYDVRPGGVFGEIIVDPEGDGGPADITIVEGGSDESSAKFKINFSTLTVVDGVVGYVHLDTDQNPNTGTPAHYLYGKPSQDVGYEYFLDLFSVPYGGPVYIWDQYWNFQGSAPATKGQHAIAFDIRLDMLGGDDGNMNVSLVLGDFVGPTDWAPDSGHGVLDGIAKWISVSPSGEAKLAPGEARDITVTVDPTLVDPGEHQGRVVALTLNDPRKRSVFTAVNFKVGNRLPQVSVGGSTVPGCTPTPTTSDPPAPLGSP